MRRHRDRRVSRAYPVVQSIEDTAMAMINHAMRTERLWNTHKSSSFFIFVNIDILIKGNHVVFLAPSFCIAELAECILDIEPTSSKKASVTMLVGLITVQLAMTKGKFTGESHRHDLVCRHQRLACRSPDQHSTF